MDLAINKARISTGIIWKLLERGGTQSVQFIIQIVLARLLTPNDFGTIAIVQIFLYIFNVFFQSGLTTALIQKKSADNIDFSSVFYMNLIISTLLYFLLFLTSPFISGFFNNSNLNILIRFLAITLFFGALNSVQNAVLTRNMQFNKSFISSLIAISISGIIGIVLAFNKFGIWALVIFQLINQFIFTAFLWFSVRWRPQAVFSLSRLIPLLKYGWKVLISALIFNSYLELSDFIIGKKFKSEKLGFYSRGRQIPSITVSNIDVSIQTVMFPALSFHQNNLKNYKNLVRKSMMTSAYIIFPLMFGLAAVALPLVKTLLTDKWIPSVFFMQIYCFTYALWPIQTANTQSIIALGRSDIILKIEILKLFINIIILAVSSIFGIFSVAIGALISSIMCVLINIYPNKKLIKYGFYEQFKDIFPILLLSIIMGISVYSINFLMINLFIKLIFQISFGIFLYYILAKLLKIEAYLFITTFLKGMHKR